MKKQLVSLFLLIAPYFLLAQTWVEAAKNAQYYVSTDSLVGFDERAAITTALSEGFSGSELKVKLFADKRRYVNNKYHLWPVKPIQQTTESFAARSAITNCTNSDFEGVSAGVVTSSNQISGWTVTSAKHVTGSDACNLISCCTQQPTESEVIYAPYGYVDPNLGSGYRIYSVFGNVACPDSVMANAFNPQINQGMRGSSFFRLNSSLNNIGMERITKTFLVSSSNAFLQYAQIFVYNGTHNCCEAGAFQVRILNATTNSVLACPPFNNGNITTFAPNPNCTNFPSSHSILLGPSSSTYAVYSATNTTIISAAFNKWNINSLDLSSYVGQNITIEFTASDCTYGGHVGYCYLDVQCGAANAFSLYGNNIASTSNSNTLTFTKCANSSLNICLPNGAVNGAWQQLSGAGSPIFSAFCFTTGTASNYVYALTVTPSGCSPPQTYTVKVVDAPPLQVITGDSLICNGSTALLFVTGAPGQIFWSTGDTTNYVVVAPSVTTNYSVNTTDIYGCTATLLTQVRVQDCTDLPDENLEPTGAMVYPNPARFELQVTLREILPNTVFEIIDYTGKVVLQQSLYWAKSHVKLSTLPQGAYLYRIKRVENTIYSGKVMVE